MASRHFIFGLLIGACGVLLLYGVQVFALGHGDPSDLTELAEVSQESAAGEESDPTVALLRQEIADLRAELQAATASGETRERSESKNGSAGTDAAPIDESAEAEPNGADRMPELLAELHDLIARGALQKRYADPESMLKFLVYTWLEAEYPDRAVALMSRFKMDKALSKYAIRAIDSLEEKGDRLTALHACVLVARSGLRRQELVVRAMKLGPARVLEELDAVMVGDKVDAAWPAQRSALLIAAGETEAAFSIVDGFLQKKGGDLPDWVWPELVSRAPKDAEARLRGKLKATTEADKKNKLNKNLALALKGQGKTREAIGIMKGLIDAKFDSDDVVEAFRT
ncbi:MAG: hypothetical protein KJO13_10430, partial [Gammaproteobacteria bacterium]|nr:hypothetical protein [Gammaproteobacteria bacterium]